MRADFAAHEANTLAGAGDRTAGLPIFADWFPIADGQVWCPQKRRASDPVHLPTAEGPVGMEDFLEAAHAFFAQFEGRKIGVQLSGGLDSSLIIGLLRYFGIPHGLVGIHSDRYEFRTERYVQEWFAAQNAETELIDARGCLPCSRLGEVPPHQIPDLLSLNHAQDLGMAHACRRLGIEVLLSGGGGDNLLGQAVPGDPRDCIWRPQTFTDPFPVEIVYRPLGITFLSFFGDLGIVNALYRLRRGQPDDYRKIWARRYFARFLPRELVEYHYCADFWGRCIEGLVESLEEIRGIHRTAFSFTDSVYFADTHLESLLAQDVYRPRKELYQRLEARISSAVWVCSFARSLGQSVVAEAAFDGCAAFSKEPVGR